MKKEESLQQKNKIEESDKKSENDKPETALKPEINNASNDSKKKELTPEDKIKDLEDKLVRSYAEIENQRRRFEKEKEDAFDYGGFSFAKEALNLIDNLERSKISLENDESLKNTKALKKTIEHLEIINKDMLSILKKNNIEEIKSINQKLDPNFHQAMMEIEDDKKESGTIVQEIQKGFMIKDRLLRPSLVAVSKKPSNKNESQEKDKKDQQNQQKNEKN
jgi:molecular chaperone GrpE